MFFLPLYPFPSLSLSVSCWCCFWYAMWTMSLLLSPLWPPRLPTVVRTLCMICVVGWWCVFHAVFSLSAYRINYHRLYREQLWIDNKMSLYTDQRQRTSYTHNSSIFMLNKCGHKKKYINYNNKQTKPNQTKTTHAHFLFCICIFKKDRESDEKMATHDCMMWNTIYAKILVHDEMQILLQM